MAVNTAQLQPEKKNCNGSTVSFDFNTVIQSADQAVLQLYEVATEAYTPLSRPADYDVTAFGPNGTTIVTTATYAAGFQLVLTRNVDRSQQDRYVYNDDFDGPALEASIDRLALVDQTQDAELYRTAKVAVGVDVPAGGYVLPVPEAGKVLVGNSGATGWESIEPAALDPDLVDMLPLLITQGGTGASSAAGARTALSVPHLAGANTFPQKQTMQVAPEVAGPDTATLVFEVGTQAKADESIIAQYDYKALDADDTEFVYARMTAEIHDPTAGSPDGRFNFYTQNNGSLDRQFRITNAGVGVGSSLGPQATGTINAAGYYLNNVLQSFGGLTLIEAEKVGDGVSTQEFSWPIDADARLILLELDEVGTTIELGNNLVLEFSENDGGSYWDGTLTGGEVAGSNQQGDFTTVTGNPQGLNTWDANLLHLDEGNLSDARPGMTGSFYIRNARDASRSLLLEGGMAGLGSGGGFLNYGTRKVLANSARVFNRFRLRLVTTGGGTKYFPTFTRARAYKVS